MKKINLPRDHWYNVLPESLHLSFFELIVMTKPEGQYLALNDLREASTALGKRRSFVGLRFVVHYPFLVCSNGQPGATWREPYYLFTTLTASYAFRFPEQESPAIPSQNGFFKIVADFDASYTFAVCEQSYLWACVQLCDGSMTTAIKLSGMSRATFYRKISQFRALGIWPK